jgi:cytochrome c-type biogenesis protein CcmE
MTPRRKRLYVVLAILGGVAASVALAVVATRDNVSFYFDPSQVASGQAPLHKRFRVGGMVVKGSVARKPGDLEVHFVLTDFAHEVPVAYSGVLPDLFREGQGIIAKGTMSNGTFVADEVLAKHDEKYMPPEVAASLKRKAESQAAAPASGPAAGSPRT